jgi:hypothetical protein
LFAEPTQAGVQAAAFDAVVGWHEAEIEHGADNPANDSWSHAWFAFVDDALGDPVDIEVAE